MHLLYLRGKLLHNRTVSYMWSRIMEYKIKITTAHQIEIGQASKSTGDDLPAPPLICGQSVTRGSMDARGASLSQ